MSDLSQAQRPLLWNISSPGWMYLLLGLALAVFAYGLIQRVAFWRRGKLDGERLGEWATRVRFLLRELVLQRRIWDSRVPGIFHSLIFYSFLVLLLVTMVVAIDVDLGITWYRGFLYVALTMAAELAGLLVLIGVGMALWRRWVTRPTTLSARRGDPWALVFFGAIVLTGFGLEGLRIASRGDPWAYLSPVGWAISYLFKGLSSQDSATAHQVLWWFHLTMAFGWIAAIPYTKFFHLIALPTNVFFAKLKPRGTMQRVDLAAALEDEDFDEDEFSVGLEHVTDFTWKQKLDFDACIGCGRCEEVCPATQVGHPFSPRQFIESCRNLIRADQPWLPRPLGGASDPSLEESDGAPPGSQEREILSADGLDDQFIWYCRTCTACMEVCPAFIDHVDTLIELRRNEVMMQERLPVEAGRALKMLESRGNPFGPQSEREDWISRLGVPVVEPGQSCDVLFFIGCCTAYDPTKQKIAEDLCRLLDRCGLDFGVLGGGERCCGDPARVLGDERLFQEVAATQIEELASRDFKVLLVSCPHCYNVLANEYPQFGGHFKVVHHSEFLHEMLWSGDLMPAVGQARRAVYHDPCYLGRYQKIYDAPREAVKALPGVQLVEMTHMREKSLCCGGGGGHFWMDLKASRRINNLRIEQVQQQGADTLITARAYCQQMLQDAVKMMDLDEQIEVIDIGSVVLASLRDSRY
jgi:Fe-S oxidoreductase/nitrate reductase gamma subunit